MASAAGVHVPVKADSRVRWPRHLTEMVPMLITVEDEGRTPVRLRYREFRLNTWICGLGAGADRDRFECTSQFMRALTLIMSVGAVLLTCSTAALAQDRDGAEDEVEFGILAAQHGLWREAEFRFERATELDPGYAAAFNNLAVVYEQMGRMQEARRAYAKARSLEPDNSLIEGNYEIFLEVAGRVPSSVDERAVADESRW